MKSFMTGMAVVLAVTVAACQRQEPADDADQAGAASEVIETAPADANAVDANAATDNSADNVTEQGSTDHGSTDH